MVRASKGNTALSLDKSPSARAFQHRRYPYWTVNRRTIVVRGCLPSGGDILEWRGAVCWAGVVGRVILYRCGCSLTRMEQGRGNFRHDGFDLNSARAASSKGTKAMQARNILFLLELEAISIGSRLSHIGHRFFLGVDDVSTCVRISPSGCSFET